MADNAKVIGSSAANQGGQALQIQTYCNSVNEQNKVDFSKFPNLKDSEEKINQGLEVAQGHSNDYLNNIQPEIITNLTNISNYYALHNAVPAVLPSGSTTKQWLTQLNVLKEQATTYKALAGSTRRSIVTLHDNLTTDTAAFHGIVINLNAKVDGDNGTLAQLDKEISKINAAIGGSIAGIVAGGLLVIGGAFVTAIGAVADFVTAGASTPVVIGGVAMMVGGAAGITAGAIVLHNSLNARNNLYSEKSTLKAEVKQAQAISAGYNSLADQAGTAVNAATQMENAWDSLIGDLGTTISNLDQGITSPGAVRELFLTAANTSVKEVITDINTIKSQMAGVTPQAIPAGQTLAAFVENEAVRSNLMIAS